MLDKLLGTIKTDNQVSLAFDTPSLLRLGLVGFLSAILAGLALKALAKTLGI